MKCLTSPPGSFSSLVFIFTDSPLLDYINERRRLSTEESFKFIREHSGLTITVGGIFSGLMLIPYAGFIWLLFWLSLRQHWVLMR